MTLPEGASLPVSSSFSKLPTVGGLLELSVFFPQAESDREKIIAAAALRNFDARRLVSAPEEFWQQGESVVSIVRGMGSFIRVFKSRL